MEYPLFVSPHAIEYVAANLKFSMGPCAEKKHRVSLFFPEEGDHFLRQRIVEIVELLKNTHATVVVFLKMCSVCEKDK